MGGGDKEKKQEPKGEGWAKEISAQCDVVRERDRVCVWVSRCNTFLMIVPGVIVCTQDQVGHLEGISHNNQKYLNDLVCLHICG